MPSSVRFDADSARALIARLPAWAWWLLAALLAFGVMLVLFRGPLAQVLMPEARVQRLLQQADAALAAGHLDAADGTGARQLYEAARAIDPDRAESRNGLRRVADAALGKARAQLDAGDAPAARQSLALARALNAPRNEVDAITHRMRLAQAKQADVQGWLDAAQLAHGNGHLLGDEEAALPLYARILAHMPTQIDALEGREDALAELLAQAQRALAAGQLDQADQMLDAVRQYDPGHVDLPSAEAVFHRRVEQTHARAAQALSRGRLLQAEVDFRLLLRVDEGDVAARRGLLDVAQAHAADASAQAAEFRFDAAETALNHARRIAPELSELAIAARHVRAARQLQARHDAAAGRGTPAQLSRLLAEAEAAQARGDLMTPPGDSAFDKLRAARAIAPNDARVRRASERMLPNARACFEAELPRNNLARARACLDAWAALGGESNATAQARRRLAARWLAIAEERIQAGELDAAAHAIDTARNTDPSVPGQAALRERLRVAKTAVED